MRLPSRTELSPEQEEIFLKAPLDGSVVIIGPPGTGKTVMAVYRSFLLGKKKKKFCLVMFNKVLKHYTGLAMKKAGLDGNISTWHKWIYAWWRGASGNKRVSLPTDGERQPDFMKAVQIYTSGKLQHKENLNWGHLLVDEGQDFPVGFYTLVNIIMSDKQIASGDTPSITVLADENQRLNPERHTTIAQICQLMSVEEPYELTLNYRNSYEIACLAERFYVGAATGTPALPSERRGGKPQLRAFADIEEEVMHVIRYAKLNDDQTIAIFFPTHIIRKKFYSLLAKPAAGAGLRLQTYVSGSDVTRLDFETGGSITLLCDASCKGLEFDAVFIPQLQRHKIEGVDETFLKMKLYVMSSRAREHLVLSYTNCDVMPDIVKLFPGKDEGVLEWKT